MFELADVSKDNQLNSDEFCHFTCYVLEAVSSIPLADHATTFDELFQRFDANRNGSLSWEEVWDSCEPILAKIKQKEYAWAAHKGMDKDDFKEMIRQMYECSDTNKNRVLSLDEFK